MLSNSDVTYIQDRITNGQDEELSEAVNILLEIVTRRKREEQQRTQKEQERRNAIKYTRAIDVEPSTIMPTLYEDDDEPYMSLACSQSPSTMMKHEDVIRRKRRVRNIAIRGGGGDKESTVAIEATSPGLTEMKKLFTDLQTEELVCDEPELKRRKLQTLRNNVRLSVVKTTSTNASQKFAWPCRRN